MEPLQLAEDFKEFLKLLNSKGVEYLLIGGYAVSYYGYPRATADLDVWVGSTAQNSKRIVEALKEFGFDGDALKPSLFRKPDQIVRMGVPPLRLEILTSISGVTFSMCYAKRQNVTMDGTELTLIHLDDLRKNKRASGRPKDLDDLNHLDQI